MSGQRALRFLPTAAVAVAGVLFGHWLSYIAALPQSHARAALLAATGHGYWTEIVRVAVALGVAGLGALLLSHLRDAGNAQREERFSALILRLVAIQSVAFVSMEALERLVARAPVASLLQSRVLVLGLAFRARPAMAGASGLRGPPLR